MLTQLKSELRKHIDSEKVKIYLKFFQTHEGGYGEGDKFLGVTVPNQRKVANLFKDLPLNDLKTLIASEYHEERLTALFILIHKYQITNDKKYVDFYLDNLIYVNNWDLVDSSADKILGHYLFTKDKDILYQLTKSEDLWERRVSIISTFYFIKHNQFEDTLKISKILLHDEHDLIHKSVGWMLREIGKRDQDVEEKFLDKYYKVMPRAMLRYSIERFSKEKKAHYMKK